MSLNSAQDINLLVYDKTSSDLFWKSLAVLEIFGNFWKMLGINWPSKYFWI